MSETAVRRFKITNENKKTYFVYGRDVNQAISRMVGLSPGSYTVEHAGHVAKNGELRIHPNELRVVMDSCAGRDSPVKS